MNDPTPPELIANAREYTRDEVYPGAVLIHCLADALEAQLAETARLQAVIDHALAATENAALMDDPYGTHVDRKVLHDILAAAGSSSALEAVKAAASEEGYQRGIDAMRAYGEEALGFEERMFDVIKDRFSGRGLGKRQAIIDAFEVFLRAPEAVKAAAFDEGNNACRAVYVSGTKLGPVVNPYRPVETEGESR